MNTKLVRFPMGNAHLGQLHAELLAARIIPPGSAVVGYPDGTLELEVPEDVDLTGVPAVIAAHVPDFTPRETRTARVLRKLAEADAALDVADTVAKRNAVLRHALGALVEWIEAGGGR